MGRFPALDGFPPLSAEETVTDESTQYLVPGVKRQSVSAGFPRMNWLTEMPYAADTEVQVSPVCAMIVSGHCFRGPGLPSEA